MLFFLLGCVPPPPDINPCEEASWHADGDGDGYGHPDQITSACEAPSGYVAAGDDCNDQDAAVHPDAAEVCDGVDNDCDGITDPTDSADAGTWYEDADGDGYGSGSGETSCGDGPDGWVEAGGDCDDDEPRSYPGAPELCDGLQNDCDDDWDDDYGRASLEGATGWDDVTDALNSSHMTLQADGTLWLCEGEFSPQLTLEGNVTIQGAGAGLSVLTATSRRLIEVEASGRSIVLEGLTLQNGLATSGGAIAFSSSGGSLTIRGSEFLDNTAEENGGAIEVRVGDLYISDTTFSGNLASSGHGGAIYYTGGGAIVVTDSALTENTADAGGGALLMTSGALEIDGSDLSMNLANSGGALKVNAGSARLSASSFTGNTAGGHGGALYTAGECYTQAADVDFDLNDPTDVYSSITGALDYGEDASFTCDQTGC